MKIALQVNGQERLFSEEELIAILEKHFSNEPTKAVSTEKGDTSVTEVAQVPTEDKWFPVDPQKLLTKEELFQKKWEELSFKEEKESQQGKTCKLILEAFEEVKNNPKKYRRKFKTMMPKMTWDRKNVPELKELACELGDYIADWVEQALEWAQRICNGESWEAICNNPDTANWYRLVVWKNGYARTVGGSRNSSHDDPASEVGSDFYYPNDSIYYTVPLVVLYEE